MKTINGKILITGADGQLGQTFTEILKKKKIDSLCLEKQELDITDPVKLEKTVRQYQPDFLINCAAYNDVDKAEQDEKTAFLINAIGVRNLARTCQQNNCVLVHYGTDYVFDGKKSSPYKTTDIPHPLNKYGRSKLQGEKYVQILCARHYLIRLSSLFGNNPATSFPLKLLAWIKGKKEITIVDDQISSPSFTKDVVKATLQLLVTKKYGLYHLTNSGYCSKYEWAKFILKEIKWLGKIFPGKENDFLMKTKRPKFSVLDNSLTEKTIKCKMPSWQKATRAFLKQMNLKK
jgi:dTDP-4-dehydrorhamnose reductase